MSTEAAIVASCGKFGFCHLEAGHNGACKGSLQIEKDQQATAEPADQEPAVLFWRGLRLERSYDFSGFGVDPRISVLYKCDDYKYRCWVKRNTHGQWIAKFEDSVYSVENTFEHAMWSALQKAINFAVWRVVELEALEDAI